MGKDNDFLKGFFGIPSARWWTPLYQLGELAGKDLKGVSKSRGDGGGGVEGVVEVVGVVLFLLVIAVTVFRALSNSDALWVLAFGATSAAIGGATAAYTYKQSKVSAVATAIATNFIVAGAAIVGIAANPYVPTGGFLDYVRGSGYLPEICLGAIALVTAEAAGVRKFKTIAGDLCRRSKTIRRAIYALVFSGAFGVGVLVYTRLHSISLPESNDSRYGFTDHDISINNALQSRLSTTDGHQVSCNGWCGELSVLLAGKRSYYWKTFDSEQCTHHDGNHGFFTLFSESGEWDRYSCTNNQHPHVRHSIMIRLIDNGKLPGPVAQP